MPSSAQDRPVTATVGRRGLLRYEYDREGPRTVLTHASCTSPWHHFPPSHLDDSGCAVTWLVNPSGGLVGGDHVSVEARLNAGAHVVMTSPSATRVYRSLGDEATQIVMLSVASGAVIEWMPEVTIPFAGSRFAQTIDVALASGATALIWDSLASGRAVRGERWAFASVRNEIRLTVSGGQRVLERSDVRPERGRVGLATDYDYVASLLVVTDRLEPTMWTQLNEQVAEVLESLGDGVLGAVSELPVPGLAVKLVARSAPDLSAAQDALWDCLRPKLVGYPVPSLRRY